MTAEIIPMRPSEAPPTRAEEVIEHLRKATERSYPVFTYKELKRVLRCEYHRMVTELREDHTWAEISLLTGMTRAGINKLGDEIPPRATHSVIRTTYTLLSEAGADGMTLSQLAATFYDRCPDLDDGPSLKEAVQALIDAGEVTVTDRRYILSGLYRAVDPALSRSIERTVARIGRTVRENEGQGDTQLHRLTFRVPERQRAVGDTTGAMLDKLIAIATEAEPDDETEDGQWVTVVFAHAPELL